MFVLIISLESLASSVSRGAAGPPATAEEVERRAWQGQGQRHSFVHPEQRQPEWRTPSNEASEALDEVSYVVLIREEYIINIKNDDFKSPKNTNHTLQILYFVGQGVSITHD